jgi:hypothetical protein
VCRWLVVDDFFLSLSIGNVVYMVGCNAWGQAVFSFASQLAPFLLGVGELTDLQRDVVCFCVFFF